MNDQFDESIPSPKPEQVASAQKLREAIARTKRGQIPPRNPRAFTDRAAAEAARKEKRTDQ